MKEIEILQNVYYDKDTNQWLIKYEYFNSFHFWND